VWPRRADILCIQVCLDLMPSQPDDYDCILGSVSDGCGDVTKPGRTLHCWFTNRWLLWEFIILKHSRPGRLTRLIEIRCCGEDGVVREELVVRPPMSMAIHAPIPLSLLARRASRFTALDGSSNCNHIVFHIDPIVICFWRLSVSISRANVPGAT